MIILRELNACLLNTTDSFTEYYLKYNSCKNILKDNKAIRYLISNRDM